jgi:hypothetical protein
MDCRCCEPDHGGLCRSTRHALGYTTAVRHGTNALIFSLCHKYWSGMLLHVPPVWDMLQVSELLLSALTVEAPFYPRLH